MEEKEPSKEELDIIEYLEDLGYGAGEICEILDNCDIEEIIETEE